MSSKDLRKAIGRLFVFGFEGKGVSSWMRECVEKHFVGGWILFARNASEPTQIWELTRGLRAPGLLWMVDHEGGRVCRMPAPVTRFPALGRLGEVGSPELVYNAHLFAARELAALGFHVNLAPVVDVRTNPDNPVVGDRSFSSHADTVAALGVHALRGLADGGVLACLKHFPGHGDTPIDSHKVLPTVHTPKATLESREWLPFRKGIQAGAPMVMMGHLLVPALDPKLPSSLSPACVDGALRTTLGYQGVVITDDLEMNGIADGYAIEERVVLALKAGVDMLLICHTPALQQRALEAVIKAVEGRILKAERIAQAAARVDALARSAQDRSARNSGELLALLGRSEHAALVQSLQG